jgi:hypothetical protein
MTSKGQSLQMRYPRRRMNSGRTTRCSISAQSVGYLCHTTVASHRISAGFTTGNFCTAYKRTAYGRYSRSVGGSTLRITFWALDETCPKQISNTISANFCIFYLFNCDVLTLTLRSTNRITPVPSVLLTNTPRSSAKKSTNVPTSGVTTLLPS